MKQEKGLQELLILEDIKEDEFLSYKYVDLKNDKIPTELGNSFDIDNYLVTYLSKNKLINKLRDTKNISEKIDLISQINKLLDNYPLTNKEIPINSKSSNKLLLSIQREREFNFYENRPLIPLSESFLYTNEYSSKLLTDFEREMVTSDEVFIIVPFISKPILRKIENIILDLEKRNKPVNIITTTFDGTGNYVDLEELCELVDKYSNFKVKVEDVDNTKERIHIKSYIFKRKTGFSTAILGSSNMTITGLITGGEWNIKISEFKDQKLFNEIKMAFDKIWNKRLIDLSNLTERDYLFEKIRLNRAKLKCEDSFTNDNKDLRQKIKELSTFYRPNFYQDSVLNKLEYRRQILNKDKHLIVMATGTGKTMVVAFDYKKQIKGNQYPSLLFIAHQKEIIEQAKTTFQNVLGDLNFGQIFSGVNKDLQNSNHIFATIQTLEKQLDLFDPSEFEYIVFDEAHHIEANTFQKVFNYFQGQKIGITATPERADGVSVAKYFDDDIAYELRIWDAIDNGMLSEFDYYCINDDFLNLINVDISKTNDVWKRIKMFDRNQLLLQKIKEYINDVNTTKCVIFCVNTEHCEQVNQFLQSVGYKSDILVSANPNVIINRYQILQNFRAGTINFLCVVNMLNEGVDIPEINTIIRLRPTNSSVLFLQQLGRGLRKLENKRLMVLDFIPKYENDQIIKSGIANLFINSDNLEQAILQQEELPPGCTITFEKFVKEKIFKMIKNIGQRNWYEKELQNQFLRNGLDGYARFFINSNLEPGHIYEKKFSFVDSILGIDNSQIKDPKLQEIRSYLQSLLKTSEPLDINIFQSFIYLNSYTILNYFKTLINNKNYIHIDLLDKLFVGSILNSSVVKKIEPQFGQNWKLYIKYIKENYQYLLYEIKLLINYKLEYEDILFKDDFKLHYIDIPRGTILTRPQILIINNIYPNLSSSLNSVYGIIMNKNKDGSLNKPIVIMASESSIDTEYGYYNKFYYETKLFLWASQRKTTANDPDDLLLKSYEDIYVFFNDIQLENRYKGFLAKVFVFLGKAQYLDSEGSNPVNFKFKIL
ncbi:DEAD/DEAH box helicase family protein [Spiroplasma eriocheiris]|uniref:DNA/RNA helicase n=1 Tax=Spiroplasma eriocheiris TaxID=315358 RepID=A0A0H3XKY0_9MOLU|nr:DEAD/DEAH box helicase family protein [Spiroplasma eriocheiris]AHF57682.1 putative ATP-dependent helicase [Spiroplasma eriocheiris CCTCC M 207170]AKM54134.1 DNA/RNA helicase [Spiroplasma eriocheiris]